MFLNFYQMREQPFGVTPDPRYLYFSPSHREALASLFYGIESGRGFVTLVAEPGLGKTTLLFQSLERWRDYVHSAYLFQTQCDARELIRYLVHDLGLNCESGDVVRMHAELNEFLFREAVAGRRVVVFIDEAQNLSDDALETVRLLSDFEATDKKLVQIVLAGQPQLERRLMRPELVQLRQRIAVTAHLEPLPASEVVLYINHRLQVAGYTGPELFTPGALASIVRYSGGVPRLINHLCFSALSIGFALEKEQISADIVREAAVDLALESEPHKPQVSVQPVRPPRPRQKSPWQQQVDSIRSWFNGKFRKREVARTSALFILLFGFALYVAMRNNSVPTHAQSGVQPRTLNAALAPNSLPTTKNTIAPRPSKPVTNQSEGTIPRIAVPAHQDPPHAPLLPSPAKAKSAQPYIIYTVQRSDNLHNICMWGLGFYDDTVLAKVRRLNPDLKDLNHLQVGQRIRLPLDFDASTKGPSGTR